LLAVNPTVGRQLPDIELQADGTGWALGAGHYSEHRLTHGE
jgi:hypothetical protein